MKNAFAQLQKLGKALISWNLLTSKTSKHKRGVKLCESSGIEYVIHRTSSYLKNLNNSEV